MSDTEYRLEDRLRKENLETKHYDAAKAKWRKIVTGGTAIAINEFSEALAADWYPRLSHDEISKEPALQTEIKHTILADWSTKRSPDGLGWNETHITHCWPEWLYRPYSERSGPKTKERKEFEQYMEQVYGCLGDFAKLAKLLADPPIIEQEDPEPLGGHKEKPKTPEELYRTTLDGYAKVIEGLTGFKDIPGPNVDIETEILNPSDKIRLRVIKGLNENDRAILMKVSSIVNQISGRFLRQARDIIKEEKRIDR